MVCWAVVSEELMLFFGMLYLNVLYDNASGK
jgi:hypothetical protein